MWVVGLNGFSWNRYLSGLLTYESVVFGTETSYIQIHTAKCVIMRWYYPGFLLELSIWYKIKVGDPTSPFWRRSALGFLWKECAKAETPVLWPPHVKSWLIGKDSDAGRDWGQEEKGTTEDEMAGWDHCLDGRESEWTAGVGDGQGGLACCDSWGRKESDMTEWLNWTVGGGWWSNFKGVRRLRGLSCGYIGLCQRLGNGIC